MGMSRKVRHSFCYPCRAAGVMTHDAQWRRCTSGALLHSPRSRLSDTNRLSYKTQSVERKI